MQAPNILGPLDPLPVVKQLLASSCPAVVYRVRRDLLGEDPAGPEMRALQEQIRISALAQGLLAHRLADGTIPIHAYGKWQGPHWTLYSLAEIGYPPGDESLLPLFEQAYHWLFSEKFLRFPATVIYPGQEERVRRCGSQEGTAIFYALQLGFADARTEQLVARLLEFQWPDGGWNCDKRLVARMSSLLETAYPLRALARYGQATGDAKLTAAARQAAQVLLERRLYKRRRDGSTIAPDFTRTVFPYYAHYSFFFALKVLAEAGYAGDARCQDALNLLESKRLPGGDFPLENRIYTVSQETTTRGSNIDWGPAGKTRGNEFVTVDALYILKRAGRL
jgi:hypothetical protein